MKTASWGVLHSGPCAPAFNMALDEALLKAMPHLAFPVLRFYGWTVPAATFGYFQKYSEVEQFTDLRPLIRRSTGGGLVPHDADWTYSLAIPPAHEWHALAAIESYRKIHEWIQAAFARLQIETEVAPCCHKTLPGQCFQGHEKFDLLLRGRKIAGAAQRRTRDGLLIQGSVQPGSIVKRVGEWTDAMRLVGEIENKTTFEEFIPPTRLLEQTEALAREKYSQAAYNQKR